jgi:putative DNA primase/helicase
MSANERSVRRSDDGRGRLSDRVAATSPERDPLARTGEFVAQRPRGARVPSLGDLVARLRELPEWDGVLALDEFDPGIVFRRPPPFARASDTFPSHVGDDDLDRVRLWLEDHAGLRAPRGLVRDAVRIIAAEHSFHPVREYLDGLVWDGVPRIATWLEDYAAVVPSGPSHTRLVQSVAAKWLISCVARAMQPGCKVDTMLVLEGRQGIGKSSALRALAGEGYFCDSPLDIRGKDACQTIQGVWIYELAELDALLRCETSVTKGFLSRAHDRFRRPYGLAPQTHPRSVVFCGTVNHDAYLKDRTGNRRFWVIRCEDLLDPEGIGKVRDQLWAEARQRYEAGEPWHLLPEDETHMREEQAARLEGDPWEERIAAWTADRRGRPFTMREVLESALGLAPHNSSPKTMSRAHQILESQGFERRRTTTQGHRPYFYTRPPPTESIEPEAEAPPSPVALSPCPTDFAKPRGTPGGSPSQGESR